MLFTECVPCIIKNSEITKSQLYRHQRSQHTWEMTMAFAAQVATVFGEDMSGGRGGGPRLQNARCTEKFL